MFMIMSSSYYLINLLVQAFTRFFSPLSVSSPLMGGLPDDVGEVTVTQVKLLKCWMSSDVGEATEGSENEQSLFLQPFPSLHLRHSLFFNPSVASSTSQFILQPFRRFIYVTAHSLTRLSPHLRHRHFTYVT